mgnify:CR=1 FL=1
MKELTKVIFKNAYRRDNVNKDITAKILSAFVFVIIFGTISSLMAFASYKLTNQLIEVDQAPAFINIILLIMIIFLFSRSVFESLNNLYFSKDLKIFLRMPIKPLQLVKSKIKNMIVSEYLMELMLLASPIIVYGIIMNVNYIFYIYSAIILLLLPIIPIVLTSLITATIMRFTNVIKNKTQVQYITVFIIFVIFSLNLYSRVGFKESTIIEKKDYGYIVYAEDYYRLYSLPSYYSEYDMLKNVDYLERALKSPFDFVNRALTIIESEESYTRYKDLMHMQFNYLITQNYIYIAGLYDKENYYFYNSQFDEDIKKSFEYAIYFYNMAKERWIITKDLAQKVMLNKSKLEMDNLIDKAYKIALGEIDYNKTADRQLKHIENILEKMNQ